MTELMSGKYLRDSFLKLFLLLGMVEVTLRCLPASDGPYTVFDKASNILKFDGSKQSDGLGTAGNLAQRKSKWHINNMGWNCGYDYSTHNNKPIVAVIGNSYIEGFIVD